MVPDIQRLVFENIQKRGYVDGYDPATLLRRQVCKLIEEIAEVEQHSPLSEVGDDLQAVGQKARRLFDDKEEWEYVSLHAKVTDSQAAGLAKELADMQVVLFVASEVLAQIMGEGPNGERYSVLAAAFNKSIGDIKRGVRQ